MQLSLARLPRLSSMTLALAALAPAALAGGGENGLTEREVFLSGGGQTTQPANVTDTSADGRYVVFHTAEAMLPADANGVVDVYVLDRQTDTLRCASENVWGITGNGNSTNGKISADGRYVVFHTFADNLLLLDGNGTYDVLRKDLSTDLLARVSGANGSIVASDGSSRFPDISADGRYVTFQSSSSDIIDGVTNGHYDIYWRDMELGFIKRLTKGFLGETNGNSWSPSISDDGTRVAFNTYASNLVLWDINGVSDVFVVDVTGSQWLLSKNTADGFADGNSYNAYISGDGERVMYTSAATDLVAGDFNGAADVFGAEISTGAVSLISARPDGITGNGDSYGAATSGNGRYVLFTSDSTNLIGQAVNQASAYVRDLETGVTRLVSRSSGVGNLPNGTSEGGALTAGGDIAFFSSHASNLDQGDTNGVQDVFSRTMFADPTSYCISSTTFAGCQPQISSNGIPSAAANSGFNVTASDVPNDKPGILFYGFGGRAQVPFLGGAVCMPTPVFRSPALFSGGNPGAIEDCSGSFSIDMNAFGAGMLGGAPAAQLSGIGQQVQAQFWGRDPSDMVHGSFLSNALEYVIGL